MSPETTSSYDTTLYQGVALHYTHPGYLAAQARLMGLDPPPVERCRVLELGCGNGSNLLPMAFSLPEAEFVGIDLAGWPIASAKEAAHTARISNAALHQLDLMDLPADWGAFDYIIAHGLYSWVPGAVRERLMEACHRHLSPNGVAFISYNVFPGWHKYLATREMMLYHTRPFSNPQKKVRQARSLLHFLRDVQSQELEERARYRAFLQEEVERTSGYADWYLLHDMLSDVNEPCYFHEFADHAARHGLQFLCEAEMRVMHARDFPPQVTRMLNQFPSLVLREQYLDFLRGRSFRQTLLCHQDATPEEALHPEQLRSFYVGSPIREIEVSDDGKTITFTGLGKRKLTTSHPLTTEACRYLGAQWPRYVHLEELVEAARAQSGSNAPKETDTRILASMLYDFNMDSLIYLRTDCPQVAHEVTERPVASPIARALLNDAPAVPTLHHSNTQFDDLKRQVLPLLDGTRDRDALLQALGNQGITSDDLENTLAALKASALLLA